jgi:hypothetical protein
MPVSRAPRQKLVVMIQVNDLAAIDDKYGVGIGQHGKPV